jgi:hypothetical protein
MSCHVLKLHMQLKRGERSHVMRLQVFKVVRRSLRFLHLEVPQNLLPFIQASDFIVRTFITEPVSTASPSSSSFNRLHVLKDRSPRKQSPIKHPSPSIIYATRKVHSRPQSRRFLVYFSHQLTSSSNNHTIRYQHILHQQLEDIHHGP